MKKCDTILVAIDFSEGSDNAFQVALSMARKFSAKLVILHVINKIADLRGYYVPLSTYEKLEEEVKDGAKKMMEDFCRQNISDYNNFESLIISGLPDKEIIKQAGEQSADLIVLGTHGRTGIDHVLFGSTAEKVVRKSPYPVLTVRLEKEAS